MSKLTQKDLLTEGFLNDIRQAAGRITKPLAKVTAGALGGVGRAALQIGKDIATGNSNATLSNVISQGVSGAKSAYKSERDRQVNASPERFLENELITNWSTIFDPASIKITNTQDAAPAFHKSFKLSEVNNFILNFEANKYNVGGGITRIKGSATITRDINGRFKLGEIKDQNGKNIVKSKRQPNTATVSATQITSNKPKFYKALRDWKIANIGPNAAAAGLTYQQFKSFLTSVGVRDADRVLKGAGIVDAGAQSVPNNKLASIEATLKSRGIIAENSQINLIKQLKILNDSYNKTYELSKH